MSDQMGGPTNGQQQVAQDDDAATLSHLQRLYENAVKRLERARPFAKGSYQSGVYDLVRRIAAQPGGIALLYNEIGRLEAAGVFADSDWAHPQALQPVLAANTLWRGDSRTAVLELLNEIRMLALARGDLQSDLMSAEDAKQFLTEVLATNFNILFGTQSEAQRVQGNTLGPAIQHLYFHLLEHVGIETILDQVVDEIWRILWQRPIQVDHVKVTIAQIAGMLANQTGEFSGSGLSANRLISALYAPTQGSWEDPGLEVYADRLSSMDNNALSQEASGLARAMHDTGLVSAYHAVFLRFIMDQNEEILALALGLSNTGIDSLLCYQSLVHELVLEAIHPETCQAIFGLALLLERGILYMPSLAPALWRQISMPLSRTTARRLTSVCGDAHPPRVFLLSGVISVLGQPFGIGQGNNPTCQAARALAMWAYNEPDYLLQMIAWAARDDEIVMHFEGQRLSSQESDEGLASEPVRDVDPVSLITVPHLDRLYMEMGRQCADRPGDPHCWINPEFHGRWVGRGCRIAVDVPSGKLKDYNGFIRDFLALYHPYYNGNRPLLHLQPAGIATTDSLGRYVGWHAIAITRVALDQNNEMRVYFFNPNNDSGQDWGQGVLVATHGTGEQYGESSLPIDQFTSRLYLFHYDPLDNKQPELVPRDLVKRIADAGRNSWGAKR